MTDQDTRARWRQATTRSIASEDTAKNTAKDTVTGTSTDTKTVTMTRRYDAPPAEVWDAWTNPDRLPRWLGTVSGTLEPGGEVLLLMTTDDKPVPCRIVDCQPERRLAVIWCQPGEPESAAEIRLRPDENGDGTIGTILTLEHGRLPKDLAVGYGYGWEDFLDRLAALLTGGDPGAISWTESQQALRPLWSAELT
jgi:uncharacterized protein YndB with AHSA1/START domain